jgi:dTDP-4-amino-4,6-dideoxygalactose transaminase
MTPPARKIPFGTVVVTERAKSLIAETLAAGRISCGRHVAEFEERFAEKIGVREAVAVSSGTDAVALALAVLHDCGASRGDEVILPALSFVATGNAVLQAGFTPVFADVLPDTLDLDPSLVEGLVTPRTRAVLPVHLMGKPAAMDEIAAIARRHGLKVVEDAAEAHGTFYKGRPAGRLGDLGAFSLYVAHIISSGEGGIVTTDDPDHAAILRSLRSHGRACSCRECALNVSSERCRKRFRGEGGADIRFVFERIGYSCKMNELEAAIGLGALDAFEDTLARRRENLRYVLERFGRFSPFLRTIREEPWERIGPHAVPVIVGEGAPFTRDALVAWMEARGVETRGLFASMPTQCPGFAFLGGKEGDFPNAERIARNGLHFGVHQGLGTEDMQYVLDVLQEFLELHA